MSSCKAACVSESADECDVNCRWKCARDAICSKKCDSSDDSCVAKQERFKCTKAASAPAPRVQQPEPAPQVQVDPVPVKPQVKPAVVVKPPTAKQECKSVNIETAKKICADKIPSSEGTLLKSCILDVCTSGPEAAAEAMMAMCDSDCNNLQCRSQTPYGKHKCAKEKEACVKYQTDNKCVCKRQCTDPTCLNERAAAGCPGDYPSSSLSIRVILILFLLLLLNS